MLNKLIKLSLILTPALMMTAAHAARDCTPGEVRFSKGDIKDAFGDNRFDDDDLNLDRLLDIYSQSCKDMQIRSASVRARFHDGETDGSVELKVNGRGIDEKDIKEDDDYRDYEFSVPGNLVFGRTVNKLQLRIDKKVSLDEIRFVLSRGQNQNVGVELGNTRRGTPMGVETVINLRDRGPYEKIRLQARDANVRVEFLLLTYGNGDIESFTALPISRDSVHDIDLGVGERARNVVSIRTYVKSGNQGYVRLVGIKRDR